jgi:hypothetical protein
LTETRPERTAAATRAREAEEAGEEEFEAAAAEMAAAALADELADVAFESASRDDRKVSSLSRGGLSNGGDSSGDVPEGETSDRLTRKVIGGGEEGGG